VSAACRRSGRRDRFRDAGEFKAFSDREPEVGTDQMYEVRAVGTTVLVLFEPDLTWA